MSKPGTFFDVHGNLMPRKRTFHLSEDAMFFTSRDKAAQYRATHPGWQDHGKWSAEVNQYVHGRLSLDEAMPALLWKFRMVWSRRDDDGCQAVMSKVMTRDGEDGLDKFMTSATADGMPVEYTKPGERGNNPDASYMKINVPDRPDKDYSANIEAGMVDLVAEWLIGAAPFDEATQQALAIGISGMINSTRYADAARLLERVGVKEGEGSGKLLVDRMISQDMLSPSYVTAFNDYLDRTWGGSDVPALTRTADTISEALRGTSPARKTFLPPSIPYNGGRVCDHLLGNLGALKIATAAKNGDPERASKSVDNVAQMISEAPRFLLDHKSLDLISQIAEGKHDLRDICAPSGLFWLEVAAANKTTFGILYIGNGTYTTVEAGCTDGDLQEGSFVVFVIDAGEMFSIRMDGKIGELPTTVKYGADRPVVGPDGDKHDLTWVSRMIAAFCFLMNSPKITERVPVEFDKLNKQRERSGKTKLLPYTSVRLTIEGRVSSSGRTSGNNGEPGTHGGKRRHMVSYFTRVKGGRIEHVRPHWRGDASLGTIIGKKVHT